MLHFCHSLSIFFNKLETLGTSIAAMFWLGFETLRSSQLYFKTRPNCLTAKQRKAPKLTFSLGTHALSIITKHYVNVNLDWFICCPVNSGACVFVCRSVCVPGDC